MEFICLQPWIPLRAENSSKSEMVSSLLFGETAQVISQNGEWLEVSCTEDGYTGFIPENYLNLKNPYQFLGNPSILKSTNSKYVEPISGQQIQLSPGSNIYDERLLMQDKQFFLEKSDTNFLPTTELADVATLFLHTPYLWGGRSIWGIDCSGLLQVAAKILNKKLPRDAQQQAHVGARIDFAFAQKNDVAFFEKNGNITHVGILTSKKEIIHAHGKVKLDTLDAQGIYQKTENKYSHQLAFIQRY